MDFNRNTQLPGASPSAHTATAATTRKNDKSDNDKWSKLGLVALVVGVTVLLLGLVVAAASSSKGSSEQNYVDKERLQAVFLSTGQVYFGNIRTLNENYFVVDNIYYLQTSNTGTEANANTSVSLVKLGCELHSPKDQMLINRSQVTFWENLQDSGQVAKAVAKFKTDNPQGQKCTDSATNASTTNNVQGSTNTKTDNVTTPAAPANTAPATRR